MAIRPRGLRWEVDVYIRRKRHRKAFDTKPQAEAYLRTLMREMAAQALDRTTPAGITFPELAARYLGYAKVNKAKSTVSVEIWRLRRLRDYFRYFDAGRITTSHVEDYKKERIKQVKPKTVNHEIVLLGSVLRKGKEWEYDVQIPNIRKLPLLKPIPRFLSKEEATKLIEACAPHIRPLVILALHTGLRRSELLSLTWADIDIPHRILRVQNPKGYRARAVPLHDKAIEALEGIKRRGKRIFNFRDFRTAWMGAVKRAGLPHTTFHTLRHTFASWLAISGATPFEIRELLGHRDLTTVLIYSHLSPEHLHKTIQGL